MKKCSKCSELKEDSAFYKGNRYKNESHPYCKPCLKIYLKGWRERSKDKLELYYQRGFKTGLKVCIARVHLAVRKGLLPNLKKDKILCFFCKKARATVYEHRDYKQPLKVKPACRSCNRNLGSATFISLTKRKRGQECFS